MVGDSSSGRMNITVNEEKFEAPTGIFSPAGASHAESTSDRQG
jgi:hypothetical protein